MQEGTPGESGGLGNWEVSPCRHRLLAGNLEAGALRPTGAPVPHLLPVLGLADTSLPHWGQRGVQPREPEASEPWFWGPYPTQKSCEQRGKADHQPTHPSSRTSPLSNPGSLPFPPRPPTAPLPAPPTGHWPRKPEHHISFLFGTFRGLFTTSPGSSPGTAPAPQRLGGPFLPHLSANVTLTGPLATSRGHPHGSPIIMPFSVLHAICQAAVDFLCLFTQHRLSRPLECKRVRRLTCFGPSPSSPVPRCPHSPHSHVPELCPPAHGSGDTKGQATTLLP